MRVSGAWKNADCFRVNRKSLTSLNDRALPVISIPPAGFAAGGGAVLPAAAGGCGAPEEAIAGICLIDSICTVLGMRSRKSCNIADQGRIWLKTVANAFVSVCNVLVSA